MNKYNISGIISFSESEKISLEEPCFFKSPSGMTTNLRSNENDEIITEMELVASDSDVAAVQLAQNEILRIANLISWLHSIPINEFRITNYTENIESQHAVFFADIVKFSDSFSAKEVLGKQTIVKLASNLAKDYDEEFKEMLLMWREALREESLGLRFFLFYRILEYPNGQNQEVRKKVDSWIRGKDPSIPLRKDRNGKDISVLTFLRDNVHAKASSFPFGDIERYLPKLQNLVRNKIEERIP